MTGRMVWSHYSHLGSEPRCPRHAESGRVEVQRVQLHYQQQRMTWCVVEAAAEAASNVHILNQAPGKWKYGTREFYQLCKKDKKCYNKEMKLGQNTSKTFMEISFVKDHLEKR